MDNNKSEINIKAYRTAEALEKYSHYGLYPNEMYLFDKYFDKNKTVLDLACGGGRTTLRLSELGYNVKGVDLSDALIEMARRRFPLLKFEIGNYCDIQESDGSYDNIFISHNGIDHAFPEDQRMKAFSECSRVIRRGGYFIFSSHNIKSLHFSPFYFKERKLWMLKNMFSAFREKVYIYDLKSWMFYCSPKYCVKQVEQFDFKLIEIVGFRNSRNSFFNTYLSPYNHYVFVKQ